MIDPEIMEQRRRECLNRLTFFMSDPRTPPNAREVFGRAECLNLLAGFFDNSKWRTVWFVLKDAAGSSWRSLKMNCWLFWQLKIRRRSWAEVEKRLD